MCRMSRSLIRLVKLIAMLAAALGANRMDLAKAGDSSKTALPTYVRGVGDFDEMERRHLIRFIVPYSKTIFFIDKGEQLGTAAEWGDEFEKWINKLRQAFQVAPHKSLKKRAHEDQGLADAAADPESKRRLRQRASEARKLADAVK